MRVSNCSNRRERLRLIGICTPFASTVADSNLPIHDTYRCTVLLLLCTRRCRPRPFFKLAPFDISWRQQTLVGPFPTASSGLPPRSEIRKAHGTVDAG